MCFETESVFGEAQIQRSNQCEQQPWKYDERAMVNSERDCREIGKEARELCEFRITHRQYYMLHVAAQDDA